MLRSWGVGGSNANHEMDNNGSYTSSECMFSMDNKYSGTVCDLYSHTEVLCILDGNVNMLLHS